jgi:hypothetical protein
MKKFRDGNPHKNSTAPFDIESRVASFDLHWSDRLTETPAMLRHIGASFSGASQI